MYTRNNKPIENLQSLNAALKDLDPSALPIDLSMPMLKTDGANLAMLDKAIKVDKTNLYLEITHEVFMPGLKELLEDLVDTYPIEYDYEAVHGGKHFQGGAGTSKFQGAPNQVNPELERAMDSQKGRIRRHAKGLRKTYYLTMPAQNYSKGLCVCIQLTYIPEGPGQDETISYHGYPDVGLHVNKLSCSSTKGGTAI